MGDGSVILRLTGLALAYGIFTLTIETSKRPIRKFVASTSFDCIAELWEMASSLWSAAAPGQDVRLRSTEQPPARASSSASRAGHRVHAHVASVPNATSKEQPLPVRVAVEDLCESCYHGWVRAEGLRALLSGAKSSCEDELFQPCRLCCEREQGLSYLQHTLHTRRVSLYATA